MARFFQKRNGAADIASPFAASKSPAPDDSIAARRSRGIVARHLRRGNASPDLTGTRPASDLLSETISPAVDGRPRVSPGG